MTIMPVQSILSAFPALRLGPICEIFFPSINTSAFSKSPTLGSRLRTMASFSTIRLDWASAGPTNVGEPSPAAASPSAPALDLRNSRRVFLPRADVSARGVGASSTFLGMGRLRRIDFSFREDQERPRLRGKSERAGARSAVRGAWRKQPPHDRSSEGQHGAELDHAAVLNQRRLEPQRAIVGVFHQNGAAVENVVEVQIPLQADPFGQLEAFSQP